MEFKLWDKKNKKFVQYDSIIPPKKNGKIYYSDGTYDAIYGKDLHITLDGRVLHCVFDSHQADVSDRFDIVEVEKC